MRQSILITFNGVFPLRDGEGNDEIMVAHTVDSPLGRLHFRSKFPGSIPDHEASAKARREIADVCRIIAQVAEDG